MSEYTANPVVIIAALNVASDADLATIVGSIDADTARGLYEELRLRRDVTLTL